MLNQNFDDNDDDQKSVSDDNLVTPLPSKIKCRIRISDIDKKENLVLVMSPLLSPRRSNKALSDIFDDKKALVLAQATDIEMKIKSAFPSKYQYSGYLSVKISSNNNNFNNKWHRKYFVLSNNFLFCGDSPYSTELTLCIALEGSNTKLTTQSSDMTFELAQISTKTVYYFRANSPQICKEWISNIEYASTLTIYDIYRFGYSLGSTGSSGSKVIQATHKISSQEYAIKIMNKKKCNDRKTLQREISILKQLKCKYIVELCDLFETSSHLYIVMELCSGGELFDAICNGKDFTEHDCCHIMHQLASGVQYMHDMGIVHRDLKPENILCVKPNSIKQIKIADFGISAIIDPKRVQKHSPFLPTQFTQQKSLSLTPNLSSNTSNQSSNKMMKTRVGTLSYTAPEILKYKPYDERVDYWSLGVIMYILVCGYPPFNGDNDYDVSYEIMNEAVYFDLPDWNHVGLSTKELVQSLLNKNPRKRGNCQDIIEHSWKVDVKNKSFFKAHSKFKQTVFRRKIAHKPRALSNADAYNVSSSNSVPLSNNNNNNKIFNRMNQLNNANISSLDDMVLKNQNNNLVSMIQFDAQHKEKQINSWKVGKKGSKTSEYLYLETMTPINFRDSIFLNDDHQDFNQFLNVVDDFGDDLPDLPAFGDNELLTYSNRSSLYTGTNRSRVGTNNTNNTNGLSPNTNTHHVKNMNSGSFNQNIRLSLLSSESFTNKRKSASKFKRKKKQKKKGIKSKIMNNNTKLNDNKQKKVNNNDNPYMIQIGYDKHNDYNDEKVNQINTNQVPSFSNTASCASSDNDIDINDNDMNMLQTIYFDNKHVQNNKDDCSGLKFIPGNVGYFM